MPEQPPNIILIMTDQQRWDALACATGGWGHTPNLDRLAREGVLFEQCYCAAPSCVPSRASFFNTDWPSSIGPMKNGDRWATSWVSQLQAAGYRTFNVGKMHTQPFDAPCGFDQRFIVENKDRFSTPRFYDDWDKHLKQRGIHPPTRLTYKEHPEYTTALGAIAWPLEKDLHWDHFVPDMAKWLIDDLDDKPVFLQIGFPGPHTPYDPPPEYLDLIDESSLPLPPDYDAGKDIPPLSTYRDIMIHGNHDGIMWSDHPSREQLLRLRKYYAANVALIDEQVGQILDHLRAKGILDNAVVVFTSDHGDALGDHGQIQKWTMYDCITRIPAIAWAPGRLPAGERSQALTAQMDLVPMIFELAGLTLDKPGSARSALSVLQGEARAREYVFAEHGGCNMLPDIEKVAMIRTREWKLVAYPNREYGELYDLRNDPDEVNNRWADPACAAERARLEKLLAAHDASMAAAS
ncbi:MAG: sulfatase-like hydrolase/transferase [Verrucomicrobiota bacterium JB024]|nr:sulfatase-like hydrolase/transferase [Verrucomicrobiota bacterium JB024]